MELFNSIRFALKIALVIALVIALKIVLKIALKIALRIALKIALVIALKIAFNNFLQFSANYLKSFIFCLISSRVNFAEKTTYLEENTFH